jgi:hypothetical protein
LINHKREKHIKHKYHFIREIISQGDTVVAKITSIENLADPFTKTLLQKTFKSHLEKMGVKWMLN